MPDSDLHVEMKYMPRDYQIPLLKAMDGGCKRGVALWARRLGKDMTAWNWLIHKALTEVHTYFYLFPTYAQGKKILWQGKDYKGQPFLSYIPEEVIVAKYETEMRIELKNKSTIQIVGVNNIDSVVGTNPYGLVLSEYALQDPRGWNLMRPILRENGGWAIFIYTPRGHNHGYRLYEMAKREEHWFSEKITIDEARREDGSLIVTQEDIDEELREGMDPDLVQQEYYCSFEGPQEGAFYGKLLKLAREEGRIGNFPWDPGHLVHTGWDIGVGTHNAIWLYQAIGLEIRFIDCIEDIGSGYGLPQFVKLLKEKPYAYGRHLVPWDIANHDWSTGRSRVETAMDMNIVFEPVVKLPVEDGIDATRRLFPRFKFNESLCGVGLEALESYCREYDDKAKEFKRKPNKDWASHFGDALRTVGVGFAEDAPAIVQTRADCDEDPLGMQDVAETDEGWVH
ncbi:hypothetical protein LCGC14_1466980 [marine sediment metagenome]|uniref:Terminase large subunit gp17-like C-terminal domain-containing protein n=1 Tax=marine sediment metagenome TaxID=412755 RepID=A0A0F9LU58_9ZZZZ